MKLYKSRYYIINGQEAEVDKVVKEEDKVEENIVKIKPAPKVKSEKVNFNKSLF
jgi:hypothetical protein